VTPTGLQTPNVFFFMMDGALIGAFFPLTGIPSLPAPPESKRVPLPITDQRNLGHKGEGMIDRPDIRYLAQSFDFAQIQ
jgi:hypothetical protein